MYNFNFYDVYLLGFYSGERGPKTHFRFPAVKMTQTNAAAELPVCPVCRVVHRCALCTQRFHQLTATAYGLLSGHGNRHRSQNSGDRLRNHSGGPLLVPVQVKSKPHPCPATAISRERLDRDRLSRRIGQIHVNRLFSRGGFLHKWHYLR